MLTLDPYVCVRFLQCALSPRIWKKSRLELRREILTSIILLKWLFSAGDYICKHLFANICLQRLQMGLFALYLSFYDTRALNLKNNCVWRLKTKAKRFLIFYLILSLVPSLCSASLSKCTHRHCEPQFLTFDFEWSSISNVRSSSISNVCFI